PQIIAVLDREYRIVEGNKRLSEAFGEWRGRRCYDVLCGRSARCEGCVAASVFVDGQSRTSSEVWLDTAGRHGYFVTRLVPVPDQEDRVAFVLAMATDVTQCERLDREHQILFERVPCHVVVLDRQLRIVRANELMRTAFGVHVGELCHQVYKHSDQRCPNCPALRSFDDGGVHTAHVVGEREDGKPGYYVVTSAPLARAGEPIEHVIEIFHDVSEIKTLETKLVRERQFLASMIDQAFDGFVAADAERRITVINPAAEQLLGVTIDELRGSTDLKRVYPAKFLALLDQGGLSCILPETTIQVGKYDIPIRFAGVAVRDGDKVLGTAGFLQDLRAVKQLEQEKLDAERLAAVGQTVAGLAHGVKNILTGLEGGMFLVRWGIEDDRRDKLEEGWKMLDRNFHKITTFVREFLSFAKGRMPTVTPTDPNRLAEEAVALYSEAARERGITIEAELQDPIPVANLDADAVHRCLANLISNAIDACLVSDDNGDRVIVRTRDHDDILEFEVEDNGCGMDYEIKRKVFTSFFTTKGTEGTGLGLLVTKKIVQEHGGFVDIESTPGFGSTFRITLPRDRLPAAAAGDRENTNGG
ncbi:MAG: PAS domain-containing protein, partial [Thermoanaerobaculales bacterium]|nr:PAS domain-containing protein [Thermoanaerobaculales bacterium]